MNRAWKAIASLALILASCSVLLTAVLFGKTSDRAKDAQRANSALCVLRNDLEVRINASTAFLKDHPEGIAGVPAKAIRDGIKNQQRTVRALSSLNCS